MKVVFFINLIVIVSWTLLQHVHRTACDAGSNTSTESVDSSTASTTFSPGRSIRLASAGVGSWREIILSRVTPAQLADHGSNQQSTSTSAAKSSATLQSSTWNFNINFLSWTIIARTFFARHWY